MTFIAAKCCLFALWNILYLSQTYPFRLHFKKLFSRVSLIFLRFDSRLEVSFYVTLLSLGFNMTNSPAKSINSIKQNLEESDV